MEPFPGTLNCNLAADVAGKVSRERLVLNRAYGYSRDQIATVLEELVATEGLVIEAADDVARAAFRYRTGSAGFSDLMILAAAERSGAHPLYTFDQKAARLEGVALLQDQAC